MFNPVAPFYEFFILLWSSLPFVFPRFVGLVFVSYFCVRLIELFWRIR